MKRSRRFLTALLVTFGTFAMASNGTANGPNSKEKVEVVTKEQGLYNLVYKTASSGKYKVSIFNENGRNVYSESFASEMSFTKLFNFSQMEYGTYTMVVTNGASERFTQKIEHKPVNHLKVDLSPLDEKGKCNLAVQGSHKKSVRVVILDQNDKQLYNELIDVKSDFSRSFDLSHITSSLVKFQVISNGAVVEKNINL